MSFEACARLVQQADPERFRATMVAPVAARRILFPLYAFNIEVSRAPWVTEEPMIAEMRLQWWRDALEEIAAGGTVRKHEVVDALVGVLDTEGAQLLDGVIAARRWDVYKDVFEDEAHFHDYIDATSGHLMWTGARLLGDADETTVRDFAHAAGIANWFRAIPALEDKNRKPLVDGTVEGVVDLSKTALTRLNAAKAARKKVSKSSSAALVAGYNARPVLSCAQQTPNTVVQAGLEPNPLRDRLRFLHVSLRGWWV